MFVFILILLVLAAIFGVFWLVVKAALFVVLTLLLSLAILAMLGWWAIKRSARKYTAGPPPGAGGSDALPPSRDDRY